MAKKFKGSGVICAKCGKEPPSGEVQGSLRHPYCKECFKEVFNNSYNKYRKFLSRTHDY